MNHASLLLLLLRLWSSLRERGGLTRVVTPVVSVAINPLPAIPIRSVSLVVHGLDTRDVRVRWRVLGVLHANCGRARTRENRTKRSRSCEVSKHFGVVHGHARCD